MSLYMSGMRYDETATKRKAGPISIDILRRIPMGDRDWSSSSWSRSLYGGVNRRRLRVVVLGKSEQAAEVSSLKTRR